MCCELTSFLVIEVMYRMERIEVGSVISVVTLAIGISIALLFQNFSDGTGAKQPRHDPVIETKLIVSDYSPQPEPQLQVAHEMEFVPIYVSEKVDGVYSIEAEYPQIKGLKGTAADKFNRWIAKYVLNDVAEFSGLEKAAVREYKRDSKKASIEESLNISYKMTLATTDLISVRFTHVVMALGQMHPIDYYVSVNYDLKAGRFLKLRDLYKQRANFLRTISRYCFDEIKRNYEMSLTTKEWMTTGLEPKAENFQNWNLTPEGIVISFEDYQVGSHAMGQPEVLVPLAVLNDLLAANSPLQRILVDDLSHW